MKGNLSGAHTGVDSGAILPGLKSQVLAHPETWDRSLLDPLTYLNLGHTEPDQLHVSLILQQAGMGMLS